MPDQLYYPPTGFRFSVEFVDISKEEVGFQSVSGLNVEYDVESHKEGGENRFEHKLPGRTKYSDLVLKRGAMPTKSKIIEWCLKAFRDREFKPVTVIVSLLNEKDAALKIWNVVHAWPKKWSVSDFNANDNSVVIETLELSYRYFDVK